MRLLWTDWGRDCWEAVRRKSEGLVSSQWGTCVVLISFWYWFGLIWFDVYPEDWQALGEIVLIFCTVHYKFPKGGVFYNYHIKFTLSGVYCNHLIRHALFLCNYMLCSSILWCLLEDNKKIIQCLWEESQIYDVISTFYWFYMINLPLEFCDVMVPSHRWRWMHQWPTTREKAGVLWR